MDTGIHFRFIDSLRFMNASLDELVSSLEPSDLNHLKHEFEDLDNDSFKLLCRKGIFSYDYINCIEKLNETYLPPIQQFDSKLNDTHISLENYQHAQNVWHKFEIKNLGEYSDLYLKTDIMLLTDVFENFRQVMHKTYGLDPAWYYTLPGYSWDCMLKYTGCKLDIIKDVDMLLFIERGIRGGVSQCCNRYSEANNKYLGADYNPL
jgi:hypothetical protein